MNILITNSTLQISHKELLRSYVQLENNLKMLEENFKINDSEKHQKICG